MGNISLQDGHFSTNLGENPSWFLDDNPHGHQIHNLVVTINDNQKWCHFWIANGTLSVFDWKAIGRTMNFHQSID
jgi:hypothetical protein